MYTMSKIKNAKSIKKPAPIVGATPKPKPTTHDADHDIQFELELCWCVQQLENALNSGKLSQKIAEDTMKNVKTLKSQTAPLIKKRQVMKVALGDYRAKMKDEEKKLALATKQIKFTPTADVNKKSCFVKKSAIMNSGKDFKFNFPTTTEPSVSNNADAAVEKNTNSENKPQVPSVNQTKTNDDHNDDVAGINKNAPLPLQFNTNNTFKFNFTIDDQSNGDVNNDDGDDTINKKFN